jgi:glycerol-3-phosphate cytidylyltransferase|tara:strand:- start:7523 stop:7966 length:444 start_codon:yes stop_codon:yes gene_type:complete
MTENFKLIRALPNRTRPQPVGIVTGVFDLMHPGHMYLLQWCRERCEFLIVMLQKFTDERPDKREPIQTWEERQLQLQGIRYVDEVIPYHTERDLSHLLSNHTPHIRFLGSDYRNTPHTGIELNQPVQYCERYKDYSTTNLIQKIKES